MNARLSHHKCSAYAHTYIISLTSQYLSNPIIAVTYEPRREKMGLRTVQTAKLQSHQKLCLLLSQAVNLDAQARLKLCCLHVSEGPFFHNAAHNMCIRDNGA